MNKGYVFSSNDLLERIGSYYASTITILIFFCTFACVFAVFYIKMNTEDRFDQTIKEKVAYFFNNDRSFSEDVARLSNSAASDAVSSELERMMLDADIDQIKQEMSDQIASLSAQIQSLQEAVSLLSPESDPDFQGDAEEIAVAHIQPGNRG